MLLSKTKYLSGLQCPKLLWMHYHARERIPEFDAATQARFDQGHEVGRLAQQLFPGGIEIVWSKGLRQTVKDSLALLPQRKPLYEASFVFGDIYARADILNPAPGGKWDIVEVKSSTEVKDVHLADLAVQRYCYQGAGIPIRRCYLMHIDSAYVRRGAVEPAGLLIAENVTRKLRAFSKGIESRIDEMLATIAVTECPAADIGPQCSDPYECPLIGLCWERVNRWDDNIFTLNNLGAKAWALYKQGIERNSRIPEDYELQSRQMIQVAAERTGQPNVDGKAIQRFLARLTPPFYFLDFETFMTAIPLLDNSRPYQQVPFQFSLHTLADLAQEPKHYSWLWDGKDDPRRLMLEQLKELLGHEGSIVIYNIAFEPARLREAAEAYPDYAEWVKGIKERIIDLMAPFKSYAVYYPCQHGSASIKAVLPALTGKSYDDLAISDGGTASDEFLRVMFTDVDNKDRRTVRHNLKEYCGLDTYGMIEIIRRLRSIAL